MGVKVFSSLIEDNRQQFTELIELKNMKLVIDGIDLVRFLHNSSSQQFMNVQFAADYVSFGRIVTNFFRNLKVNNVQAYVILYGAGKAYAQSDDAKRSREPSRSHGLKLVAQLSEKFHAPPETLSNKLNQFPILSIEMFRNVLAQLNIPCIRTVLGGGPTMAKLANQLNCPVLSFNSDCYLFDLKKGFVNFSTLRFNSDTSLEKYVIRGRVYFRSTLINRFQLKPEVLPFFAVVFSNTSRDTSKPTGIVDTLTKMRARIFVSIKTKNLIKSLMVKLLNWLKHMTLEDAIRNFCDQMRE
ncbi:Protein asteroid -like protein 1 [Halotydeus destructor]|nr:Protein asteroid -like protein 1 [Halotydeus destructor]